MTGEYFIGLMTGTSLDGVDAVLVQASHDNMQLIDALELAIPRPLYLELLGLCQASDNEIERMGRADRQLARLYAQACQQLLSNNQLTTEHISAIGSHGQTIRHQPGGDSAFSLQIGDPNTLAQLTDITTVADFRRRDIAAGGQGAPLAPVFHAAAFGSTEHNRAIINIGGMANISLLHSDGTVSGYDTGPGNVLMNAWVEQQQGKPYDQGGLWASSGHIEPDLLQRLLSHPYFAAPSPKSTGREVFNLAWLAQQLEGGHYPAENVQATLLELTAQTISQELIKTARHFNEVYICGGGSYNTQLMLRLETLLHPRLIASTATLGLAPEWVEAACFAWLAQQTLQKKAVQTQNITGAKQAQILGGVYYA